MSYEYERPLAGDGLRLHLNENTAGCSPRVHDALRRVSREQAAIYPDYDGAARACAARFGVHANNVLLTNGLDEGILLASLIGLRGALPSEPYEAIVVQPAFDMYAACADAAGGRVVDIAPQADFFFRLKSVLEAVTPRTRVIFLTNPNNPTGLSIPRETIASLAAAVPQATIFLDEAYADFSGETLIQAAASGLIPNLIVGRTFAKAYGLAGLRVGALIGTPENLAPMRRAIPPYSLNVYAAVALPAALEDVAYFDWYLAEVVESKKLIYDVLVRHGIRFWPSDGNFVLACFDEKLPAIVEGLARRGIFIRDRSGDPGCTGCARITAGVVEHTRQAVAALEELL